MRVDEENPTRSVASRLLGRGARNLGLAALAHARGHKALQDPWYVLAPYMVASAEEVLNYLERSPDAKIVDSVVLAAMDEPPCVATPSWAEPLWRNPAALSMVGEAFPTERLTAALGTKPGTPSPRHRGLAALSIALCRGLDGLRALAERLPREEGALAVRMGHLASCTVAPAEPSSVRGKMRELLKEYRLGKDH